MLGIGAADPLLAESLEAELEGLLASHPDIRARQKSAAAAEQGIRVAYSGYVPKLDIFSEFVNSLDPDDPRAGGGSSGPG